MNIRHKGNLKVGDADMHVRFLYAFYIYKILYAYK